MKIYQPTLRLPVISIASAKKTSNQTITTGGSGEALTWDEIVEDSGGWFDLGSDNTVATVPAGVGLVDIIATVRWAAEAGASRQSSVQVNSTDLSPEILIKTQHTAGRVAQHSLVGWSIPVSDGDTVRIVAFQQTGGDKDVLGASDDTFFQIIGHSL
jgi:hypothetical protein